LLNTGAVQEAEKIQSEITSDVQLPSAGDSI
jgi:hypothetical protein